MSEPKYKVLWETLVLARDMSLEHALLFVEAMFHKWYGQTDAQYTIAREEEA